MIILIKNIEDNMNFLAYNIIYSYNYVIFIVYLI